MKWLKQLRIKSWLLISTAMLIFGSTFIGCSAIEKNEVVYDNDPVEFENISEGVYIMTADGEFYKANKKGQTFSDETDTSNPSRLVLSQNDSKYIPTLYSDDKLVYFSQNSIPEKIGIERFEDLGYCPGIFGLDKGSNGTISIQEQNVISGCSAGNELGSYIGSGGIVSVLTINGKNSSAASLNIAGGFSGYKQGDKLKLGLMKGTYYSEVTIDTDLHVYSSAATDCISSYSTTKNGYIVLDLPGSIYQGYVSINNEGLMYISKENRPNKSN